MNSWVPRRGGRGLAPPSPPPPRTSGRQNFSAKHLVPTPYSIQIESPPGASKMPQDASWAVLETIWGPIWGRIGAPDLPQIVCFPFAFVDFHTSSRFYETPQNPKENPLFPDAPKPNFDSLTTANLSQIGVREGPGAPGTAQRSDCLNAGPRHTSLRARGPTRARSLHPHNLTPNASGHTLVH